MSEVSRGSGGVSRGPARNGISRVTVVADDGVPLAATIEGHRAPHSPSSWCTATARKPTAGRTCASAWPAPMYASCVTTNGDMDVRVRVRFPP